MAALDFPASPTVGQTYPVPPVNGVPVYTWDGAKWTAVSGAPVAVQPATAIPLMDATPGVVGGSIKYTREDHVHPTDTSRVAKAGDTMTGSLVLNADPSAALGAVTKQYVDAKVSQRIPLVGVKQVDVQVPAGAKVAQLTGVIYPSSATAINSLIQLSATASVFVGAAGQYILNGFSHTTASLNTVAGSSADVTRPGMLVVASHNSQIVPIMFTGNLTLARPATAAFYKGIFQSTFFINPDYYTSFYANTSVMSNVGLSVLAFRFISGTGDNFAAESYLNVGWL